MSWLLFILAAAIFLGLHDVAQKKALKKEHASAFLSAAGIINALVSLLLLVTGTIKLISLSLFGLIILKSIFAVTFFTLIVMALRHLNISEFDPLMNLSPIFLLVIAAIFLGERVTGLQILGIGFVIAGAYILELKDSLFSPIKRVENNKYIHLMVLGMIFASLAAAMDRYILIQQINVESFYLYQRIIIAILLILISVIFYDGFKDIKTAYKRSFIWIIIPSLLYMVGDYLYFLAVAAPVAMISLVIPVKRTSTLVATIVGGNFFREKHLIRKTLACLVMIFGVFLIVL